MREDELYPQDCFPGLVVFARVKAFPWWPAVIGRSSEGTSNEWKDSKGRHWVFFLGDDQGAWLPLSNMRSFSHYNQQTLLKANDRNDKYDKFREKIQRAVVLAKQFRSLPSPPTQSLSEYNSRITPAAIDPTADKDDEDLGDANNNRALTETSDEELTDSGQNEAVVDQHDEELQSGDDEFMRLSDGDDGSVNQEPVTEQALVPNGNHRAAPAETGGPAQTQVDQVEEPGNPGKSVSPKTFYADVVKKDLGLHQKTDSLPTGSSHIEKALAETLSSPASPPKQAKALVGPAMGTKDTLAIDDAPSTKVQEPVPPIEYGRSKRKRVKSTKLNDFVDPIKKYRKRKNSRRNTRVGAKNSPENPEDIVEPADSTSSPSPPPPTPGVRPISATEDSMDPLRYPIPLRLPLVKTAHKIEPTENAPPPKRNTRSMIPNQETDRIESAATSSSSKSTPVVDLDSANNASRDQDGKKKGTEPWKSGMDDVEGTDNEGDTVGKKDIPNSSPRIQVVDNGNGKAGFKVVIPKKALGVSPVVPTGEVKRRVGRPPKGSRGGLVAIGAGVSKRGAHLKRSYPTRQTPPRKVRQLSEQAATSTSVAGPSSSGAAGSKKVSTRGGNKNNANSTAAEPPRVKRKYRKRGTANKDGISAEGRGTKRSSERLKEKDAPDGDNNAIETADGNGTAEIDPAAPGNTVNILNGVEVPEGERQQSRKRPRNHYGSHKSTARQIPPLPALPVGDIDTESETEEIVTQRINALKNAAPAAQQENIDQMMARIANLEAHVHRLNKKAEERNQDSFAELMRISAPSVAIARLKTAAEMVFVGIREVVDDADYNPEKLAEVIRDIWPQEEDNDNHEPDRREKEGIRSAVRGLLWDRQARGYRAHKIRKERREKNLRVNNDENGTGNNNNSQDMAVDLPVDGSDPNSSGGQSATQSN